MNKVAVGMLVGTILLLVSNYTTNSQLKLFIAGVHIHHSILGISLLVISRYWKSKYSPYLLGIGIILILDQLPSLLGSLTGGSFGIWD
jgi:hypothetical protein